MLREMAHKGETVDYIEYIEGSQTCKREEQNKYACSRR